MHQVLEKALAVESWTRIAVHKAGPPPFQLLSHLCGRHSMTHWRTATIRDTLVSVVKLTFRSQPSVCKQTIPFDSVFATPLENHFTNVLSDLRDIAQNPS